MEQENQNIITSESQVPRQSTHAQRSVSEPDDCCGCCVYRNTQPSASNKKPEKGNQFSGTNAGTSDTFIPFSDTGPHYGNSGGGGDDSGWSGGDTGGCSGGDTGGGCDSGGGGGDCGGGGGDSGGGSCD